VLIFNHTLPRALYPSHTVLCFLICFLNPYDHSGAGSGSLGRERKRPRRLRMEVWEEEEGEEGGSRLPAYLADVDGVIVRARFGGRAGGRKGGRETYQEKRKERRGEAAADICLLLISLVAYINFTAKPPSRDFHALSPGFGKGFRPPLPPSRPPPRPPRPPILRARPPVPG
jgi:hypothetical protein